MPVRASSKRRRKDHFVSRWPGPGTLNGICARVNPSHAVMPLKNTLPLFHLQATPSRLRVHQFKIRGALQINSSQLIEDHIEKQGAQFTDKDSCPRLIFTASTMSAPVDCHSRTMSGKSAGGCCPSPSITITTSPRARSRPAQRASSFPKFLLRRSPHKAGNVLPLRR